MFSNVSRLDDYRNRLCEFIRVEYGVESVGIAPAKRGFYAETWRLDSENKSYFLKLDYSPHQSIYESSFSVIEHLCVHGIDFISKVVKTKHGDLSTRFDGAVLGVFDWVDGEHIETNETKIPEYNMLARVYQVPAGNVRISKEDFTSKCVDKFYAQCDAMDDERIKSLLEKRRALFKHRATKLKLFSEKCRGDTSGFVITHGDAGGNLIKDGERYFLVDWDDPILAPPDRDAWVMCNRDWARDAFHGALRQHGITYTLRPERLAYYCYHFFFFYLTAFLESYKLSEIVQELEDYIDGWIQDSFRYVDSIQ